MKALEHNNDTSLYVPHYRARSLQDVDFNLLAGKGVKYIAFDADSTLVPYRGKTISEETRHYLMSIRPLFQGWCIASNRITNDLGPMPESINAHVIRARGTVRKPQTKFFKRVTDYFKDADPQQIVMIGDKLLADIYGANRAGFITVWVEHLGQDGPLDRLFFVREMEKRILERYYTAQ